MPLSPEVIGRIILSKFLSFSLKSYERILNEVESSPIFRTLLSDLITFEMFPQVRVASEKEELNPNTLGRIEQDGENFYIRYRRLGFAGEYKFDRKKLNMLIENGNFPEFQRDEINLFTRKLRLISTRNRIIYITLLGIIEHQTAYLKSSNPLELMPLSQIKLSDWIKGQGYLSIDNSIISRVVNGTSVLLPDGKLMPLKDFFLSSREICKGYIKEIFRNEEMKLKSNRLNRPYTDEEIKDKLKKGYSLNILRRSVSYCRNQMGIPPFYRRTYDNRYASRWIHFSTHFPMNLSSVKENAPEMSGIYELSLENVDIEYPLKRAEVFYIGSAKNIRKRLKTHLGSCSENGDLYTFTDGGKCFFQVCHLQ